MRFKVPKSYQSVGMTIPVEFIDGPLTDNDGKFTTDYKVLISKDSTTPEITFWHEFYHGCCHHLGIKLEEDQEEHLCELFAQLTMQMFNTAE